MRPRGERKIHMKARMILMSNVDNKDQDVASALRVSRSSLVEPSTRPSPANTKGRGVGARRGRTSRTTHTVGAEILFSTKTCHGQQSPWVTGNLVAHCDSRCPCVSAIRYCGAHGGDGGDDGAVGAGD